MRWFLLVLLLAAGMANPARAADADPAGALVLSPAQIKAGGIASAPLPPVRRAATVIGYGRVLDAGPVAVAAARLAAAQAAVTQAGTRLTLADAQAARATTLFRDQHNISQQQYDTAQSGAAVAQSTLAVAQAQLRAAQAQVLADWGAALATAIRTDAAPVADLTQGAACLVQVTLPLGVALAAAPQQAQAEPPAGTAIPLRLIGPSPRTPTGSGPSWFYLAAGAACPPAGVMLEAHLPAGRERDGVVVPVAAMIWRDGAPYAFRDDGAGGFAAVPLADAVPVDGGYFIAARPDAPLRAGQKVVVKGAALLLSQAETPPPSKAPAGGGDDDDD
jgi:hypothetical protein